MCKNCSKNPVHILLSGRKLCKKCFCSYFEKKFLKTIRKYNTKKIIAKDDISLAILKKLTRKEEKKAKGKAKIILPDSLDDISRSIINYLLKNKISRLRRFFPTYKNFIRPFYFLTDKEIALYAKIKNLKWKRKKKGKEKNISNFLNEMEKKHPEIKYAIVNSFLKLFSSQYFLT